MSLFQKGKILFENYVFEKKIGKGANGIVVEAKKNKTKYAIKIQNTNGEFNNEINILQKLPQEKYFLKLIDFYIDNEKNKSFIVTELIENHINLDNFIKTCNYNLKTMFNISKQLCESIYLLHKSNICHGDFFPKNIMISPKTLDIKVIDYGSGYFLNEPNFVSFFNKIEGEKLKTKTDAKKKAKTNDLIYLGMTIYSLISFGRDFNMDFSQTQNTCGINSLFENKKEMFELINACHISDEFLKIAKNKNYSFYKSLSTLLHPYYMIVTANEKK